MFIVIFDCYRVESILIQSINSCVFQVPKECNDLMVEGTWADWSQGIPQSFIMQQNHVRGLVGGVQRQLLSKSRKKRDRGEMVLTFHKGI